MAQPEAAAFIQAQAHAVGAVVGGERPGGAVPNLPGNGAVAGAGERVGNEVEERREENVVDAWEGAVGGGLAGNDTRSEPSVVESLDSLALDAERDFHQQRPFRHNQVRRD